MGIMSRNISYNTADQNDIIGFLGAGELTADQQRILGNVRKYAEAHCPEARFEEITRKNCPACGKQVSAYPQKNAPFLLYAYHGTLYYRCL